MNNAQKLKTQLDKTITRSILNPLGKQMATETKDLIIDVGSNHGEFALQIAERNPNIEVIAIEPNDNLSKKIEESCKSKNIKNIEVVNLAIDRTEGKSSFHISDHADSGISSLLPFEIEKITNDSYWKDRKDLHYDRKIEVIVKRLDSILNDKKINKIRFIKIDAQGVDLNVLESLGSYLEITDAGMLEVPATLENNLYSGETADLQKTLNFLTHFNFKIYGIKPNDHAANEFNVFFCKKNICWKTMEKELGLKNFNLYDGKNFWHYPSNKWEPVEAKINELTQKEIALTEEKRILNQTIKNITSDTEKLQFVIKEQNLAIKKLLEDNTYLHSLFSVRMRAFFKSLILRK